MLNNSKEVERLVDKEVCSYSLIAVKCSTTNRKRGFEESVGVCVYVCVLIVIGLACSVIVP